MRNCASFLAACICLAGPAEAERILVPSDMKATYDIDVLDVGMGKRALLVISKRVGPSGTYFTAREVNCLADTFRYVGEGDTFEKMKANINERGTMSTLVEGSISYYIVNAACR